MIKRRMIDYVRGTYLLLCGKYSKQVKDVIANAYIDIKASDLLLPPPPSSMHLSKYLSFKKFSESIRVANLVQGKVIDPYNVYCPIVDVYEPDIDFHDEDFTWIKK